MKLRTIFEFINTKNTLKKGEHHLLLAWLIFTGIFIFSILVSWNEDLLIKLYLGDKSYISYAISIMYIFIAFHCASRVFYISSQINASKTIEKLLHSNRNINLGMSDDKIHINGNEILPDCIVTNFIHDLLNKAPRNPDLADNLSDSDTKLIEIYEARLKAPHEIGWYSADIMIRLGLLGTVIGFILMLGSVANITDFDITSLQKILKHMSTGMGTALYTTMAGLVCSMLTTFQYHMLDSSIDELILATKHLAQVHILPKVN